MSTTLSELREAYGLSSGASSLTPKIIDRLLSELVRFYEPLRVALPRRTWLTDQFIFNRRTALPKAQFTTPAPATTDVAPSNSNYAQTSFAIRNLQGQIDISTFAAQVATVNGNLYDLELAGLAQNMGWLEGMAHMYGMSAASANTKRPMWDGVDALIATANKIDGANQKVTLNGLDGLIDSVKGVAAQELGDDWFFLASPKMESGINSLFVNQQRFNSNTEIFSRDDFGNPNDIVADNHISAGVEVATYRGVPIILSSFMSNRGQMGAISSTNNTGTGSSLTATTTYYYQVEAVSRYGLTYASAEISVAPAANGDNNVLSWTTPTPLDAYGNVIDILGYRIFRSTSGTGGSGAETLYALVNGYDLSDNPVLSFTDTGLVQNPLTTPTLYWATVASSGNNAVSDGVTFPRATATTEDIFLIPRDPELCVVPVLNEMSTQMLAPVNARTRQFAATADMTLALRAPSFAAKLCRVKTA